MNKEIELCRKLNELVKRGYGGEKTNAEIILKMMMKKYNIAIEQIEESIRTDHYFKKIKDRRFLIQIISSVLGSAKNLTVYLCRAKDMVFLICTDAEFIEIQAKYEFYYSAYLNELDIFYHAFVQANHIYTLTTEDNMAEIKKLSDQDRKILAMASGIENYKYRKQLI